MTNEELAAAIQSGETERMAELWAGVENLVKWKANRILSALDAPVGVEFDDLCNMGYIALTKAVPTYKPDSGAFSTWFMFYLQTAFAEATGYRTGKQRRDPLRNALSLDEPLQDADGLTLADSLAADTDTETEVLASMRQSELRRELESILQQIGGIGAQVMRLRYFENMPYERIAAALHIPIAQAQQEGNRAMARLREPDILERLRPFRDGAGRRTASGRRNGRVDTTVPISERIGALAARRNSIAQKEE